MRIFYLSQDKNNLTHTTCNCKNPVVLIAFPIQPRYNNSRISVRKYPFLLVYPPHSLQPLLTLQAYLAHA